MNSKLLFALLIVINLSACSSKQILIISPDLQLQTNSTVFYQGKQANLIVNDLRVSKHVIQINKKNKAAELVNSQSALSNIIEKNLQPEYEKQGLLLNNISAQIIEVNILKALINVEQSLVKYTSSREIELQVTIKEKGNSISKKFSLKGQNNGPLKADLAVLGRDFNQGISKLLAQILNDTELQQAVK